jgi:uncharacterized protein
LLFFPYFAKIFSNIGGKSMLLSYFFVVLAANLLGSITGMGGGVLIKPLFDLMNIHSLDAISFYSCIAVLSMAFVAMLGKMRQVPLRYSIALLLCLGSMLGGIIGTLLFAVLLKSVGANTTLLCQIALSLGALGLALAHAFFSSTTLRAKSNWLYALVGLATGSLSSFLGIGGGPINMALLMFIFGLPIKHASLYSLLLIFFSQLSKLLSISLGSGILHYDLQVLWALVPAGILGGYVGAKLGHHLPEATLRILYIGSLLLVILLNLYNAFALMMGSA